ncbi:MAG: YHS domain-containing protein [Rhodospirillales bacterium]|nr:YHS domain-containing protein [Rhodospirillales bacterium]
MFSSLLWFGLIALFFFMMMRGGCGGHVMGHGHHDDGRDHGSPPPGGGPMGHADETAIDPVCGMQVATATAKSSVYRGIAYYFCSAEHRDAFEANPAAYLGQTPPASGHEEAHTHG